jgi:DUF1009 family protein
VVARAYILAVEAAECTTVLLQRVGALRQWGFGRSKRRMGALVRRIGWLDGDDAVGRLMGEAAAQGLAGIAVTGPKDLLEPYDRAARSADAHGLFLVTCEM